MKKLLVIFYVLVFTFSCSSSKELKGKKFIYKSQNRELLLTFSSNSMCSIKNTFFCDDVEDKFKEITVNATYKIQGNMIILKNITCKDDSCIYQQNIEIPIQKSSNCSFLNNEGRNSKTVFDGRTYQSDYHKYGLVPNIDIDTMHISNGKIILIKKNNNGNFGFIFE